MSNWLRNKKLTVKSLKLLITKKNLAKKFIKSEMQIKVITKLYKAPKLAVNSGPTQRICCKEMLNSQIKLIIVAIFDFKRFKFQLNNFELLSYLERIIKLIVQ